MWIISFPKYLLDVTYLLQQPFHVYQSATLWNHQKRRKREKKEQEIASGVKNRQGNLVYRSTIDLNLCCSSAVNTLSWSSVLQQDTYELNNKARRVRYVARALCKTLLYIRPYVNEKRSFRSGCNVAARTDRGCTCKIEQESMRPVLVFLSLGVL